MIYLVTLVVAAVICAGGFYILQTIDDPMIGLFATLLVMAPLLYILFTPATLVVNHLVVPAQVEELVAMQATVDAARDNGLPLESATIQADIIRMNRWLASAQYYAEHPFLHVFWPDVVLSAEPVR